MQKMDCQAIGYGYIIIPKALLKEQLIDCSPHEGEIEAFLKLLVKVNYSETKLTDHQRRTIVCKRGESLHSYRSWSAIFHWPTSRTYRFIQQLKTNGIIEIIPHNDTTALHIRVVNYENWTNISTLLNEKKRKHTKNQRRKVPPLLGRLPQHPAAPQREHRQGAAYLEKAERKRTATRHRPYRRLLLSSGKYKIHVTCLQLFIQ